MITSTRRSMYANVLPAVMVQDINSKTVVTNFSCGYATLIFIDLEPDANWPHECLYILAFGDNWAPEAVHHNWPPAANIELRKCASYS